MLYIQVESTGEPKGVQLTYGNFYNYMNAVCISG